MYESFSIWTRVLSTERLLSRLGVLRLYQTNLLPAFRVDVVVPRETHRIRYTVQTFCLNTSLFQLYFH